MENIQELFQQIVSKPVPSLTIILNLVLIESLLSVDNAAVLATMVLHLPKDQRGRALRIGIIGAYFFRGLCLLFASILISIWWFKPLGGIYLLFLSVKHFFSKKKTNKEDNVEEVIEQEENSWLYRKTLGAFGPFWATVISVELMDLVFSIDNVIAANAYTPNIILIWAGVFIGILAMRFVAQGFVKMLNKYPFLETSAYAIIGILGLKLGLSVITHYYHNDLTAAMESEKADMLTSILSFAIFIVPVLTSFLFNFPKHMNDDEINKS